MNIRMILRLLGMVLQYEGLLLLPAMIVSLIHRETCWWAILLSATISIGIGTLLRRISSPKKRMHVREGFAAVVMIWISASLMGALPFVISRAIPNYLDAVFEVVSGFTTTGSTILTDVEALPKGLHFWRAFTHWLGGMGILVMTIALIPSLGASSTMYLLRAESPGPTSEKLMPKYKESAKTLYLLYIALSIVLLLLLLALGMPVLDAFIHTFATAGTGGFSNQALSVGAYGSPAVEWVLSIFMALFGINFVVLHLFVTRRFRKAFQNSELRLYLTVNLAAWFLIAVNTRPLYEGWAPTIRNALFQVTSIMSTTGFATVDFALWPVFSQAVLMIIMLIGGCAGSTAGGLKVIRVLILTKSVRNEVDSIIHPRMVRTVKMEGHQVEKEVIHSVLNYFVILIALFFIGTLIISLDGYDMITSATAVWTCLNNTGPGLGLAGPMGSFAIFSPLSKVALIGAMLLGRLEIFPVLLLISRPFWRKA